MSKPLTVLIVEDEHHTRKRLADAIRSHAELSLVGETDCITKGMNSLLSLQPDVLLTDLNLPDGNGIDLIRQAAIDNTTESIVITVFGDEKHVVSALQAGAGGYLLKDCDEVEVCRAVLQIRAGGSPISPSIARYLLKHFRSNEPQTAATCIDNEEPKSNVVDIHGDAQSSSVVSLTRRENEVLRLIAKGFSYQEIASTLNVSIHTVSSHIKHIYRKLAVGSRGEAVYEASQIGLL